MNKLPKIYISPINEPILNAMLCFGDKIGIIMSKRQYGYDGGYVKQKIIKKAFDTDAVLERDHFCIKGISLGEIEFEARTFDIIHIDPWYLNDYKINAPVEWIKLFLEYNNEIKFEIGTEDFIQKLEIKDYEALIKKIGKKTNSIEYLVCQGGSVVFNLKNISPIDVEKTKAFINLGKKLGIKIKRHNCDFHTNEELNLLVDLGVDAFNFAPEFTYISNKVILENLTTEDKTLFVNKIKKTAPWQRWLDNDNDENLLILACAHYLDNDLTMEKYIKKFSNEIESKVCDRIEQLCRIIYK